MDNIQMDLKEVECEGVNWIELVQDRAQLWSLVKLVMNICIQ